jgi:ABC-type transport system involved in multi-copper enzyme maturation permease subunit
MNAYLIALRAEIFVALRSNSARLVVIAPALIACAQLILGNLISASQQASDALMGASSFGQIDGADAWGSLVDAYLTGLTVSGLILVTYAAWSLAADQDSGVLRHILIRRVSRRTAVMAKLTLAHILGLLALMLMLSVSTLCAWLLWDFVPVAEDGYVLIATEEIIDEIRLGLTLAIIPLPAAIALGIAISVLASNGTQAIVAALGITLAMDILKGLAGSMADYLYISYLPSLLNESYLQDVSRLVRGFSDVMIDPAAMQLNYWVPWPQLLIFVVIALMAISRKRL